MEEKSSFFFPSPSHPHTQFSRWVIDVDLEMSLLKGVWGSVGFVLWKFFLVLGNGIWVVRCFPQKVGGFLGMCSPPLYSSLDEKLKYWDIDLESWINFLGLLGIL